MTNLFSRKPRKTESLCDILIVLCQDVQRRLGHHCDALAYQRTLEAALSARGLAFQRDVEIVYTQNGEQVAKRQVAFVVEHEERQCILEIRAVSELTADDMGLCMMNMEHGGKQCCLLVNFGEKPMRTMRCAELVCDGKN